jgi:hypothetical protein
MMSAALGKKIAFVLGFSHTLMTSASGRKDTKHQKTAMHTVATIVYEEGRHDADGEMFP